MGEFVCSQIHFCGIIKETPRGESMQQKLALRQGTNTMIEPQLTVRQYRVRQRYWRDRWQMYRFCAQAPSKWLKAHRQQIIAGDEKTLQELYEQESVICNAIEICINLVLPKLGSKPQCIEPGCGAGFITAAIMPTIWRMGGQHHATDFVQEAIDQARLNIAKTGLHNQAGYITYGVAQELTHSEQMQYQPFPEDFADIIIFSRVGNHILDAMQWKMACDRMRAVLKPGGYLILVETLLDHNPHRIEEMRKQVGKRKRSSAFRSKAEYEQHLRPLRIEYETTIQYFTDVDYVGIWRLS